MAPPDFPLARGRRATFDAGVTDAIHHLGIHTPEVLNVDVHITEVPEHVPESGPVPLGEIDRTHAPVRLVVHRQPVMIRVRNDLDDCRLLVRDLLAELVADLMCRDPHDIDPHYPRI